MAKISNDEAQIQLDKLAEAIKGLQASNIPVPEILQAQFDKLSKQLTGSASSQLAKILNDTIGVSLNDGSKPKNVELKNSIIAAIGDKAKLQLTVKKTTVDGSEVVTLSFEPVSSGGGGTASTGNAGVERSAQKFNHYVVEMIAQPVDKDGQAIVYAENCFEGSSASAAKDYILNGGKNPMNLGAEFGTGNAATRVLLGVNLDGTGGFAANEECKKYFKITASHVDQPKKVEAPAEPTTTEATA